MSNTRKGLIGRYSKVALGALVMAQLAGLPTEASAQGLFETLFGNLRQPARAASAADPRSALPGATAIQIAGTGHSTYCVRLCDGRFFPMQQHGAAAAQTCNALCPASTTKTFSGSAIATAVAADGSRYSRLENAFVYRNRLVQGCTCNGKDSFGLAPLSISADTTVRAGDLVATQDGVTVVKSTTVKYSARETTATVVNR